MSWMLTPRTQQDLKSGRPTGLALKPWEFGRSLANFVSLHTKVALKPRAVEDGTLYGPSSDH